VFAKFVNKDRIFHPYGLAIYPLLALYAHNRDQVEFHEIGVYLLGALALAVVCVWGVRTFLKDPPKAGLLTSMIFFLFFSFGHFYQVFYNLKIKAGPWTFGPSAACYLLYFILISAAVVGILRTSGAACRSFSRFLNILCATLLLVCLMPMAAAAFSRKPSAAARGTLPEAVLERIPVSRPDIYYFLLDGYPRHDMLLANMGLDNTPFLEYLKGKGFFIDPSSRSNYAQTYLSLSSILNMEYLEDAAREAGKESHSMRPLRDRIVRNKVFAALKKWGYQIIVFDSGYAGTNLMLADRHIAFHGGLSEFQNEILNLTPVPSILRFLNRGRALQFDLHRQKTRYVLDHLADSVALKSPKIIFTHLLMPHPPFIFSESGESVTPAGLFQTGMPEMNPENIRKHNGQLRYLNRRIEEIIDTVLAKSAEAPVIILQSDHGLKAKLDIHEAHHTQAELQDGFYNLGAYYFPGGGREKLYEGMTPVNTFRVLFSHYFNEPLTRLAERSFFSTSERPYAFEEVTEKIAPSGTPA